MFNRLLGAILRHPGTPPPAVAVPPSLSLAVDDLRARVEALERSETLRNAEHLAMCDRLDRLFKRLVARMARDPQLQLEGESVLSLRERLGR